MALYPGILPTPFISASTVFVLDGREDVFFNPETQRVEQKMLLNGYRALLLYGNLLQVLMATTHFAVCEGHGALFEGVVNLSVAIPRIP